MPGNESWWVAMVTFERTDAEQDILPDDAQGACGWMACLATDETNLRQLIDRDLKSLGLRLLEIEDDQRVVDDDFAAFDDHLSENVLEREPGRKSVWGTIHVYLADGET